MLRAAVSNSVKSISRHHRSSYAVAVGRQRHYYSSGVGSKRLPWNLGIQFVPENKAYVLERFGKYWATLQPGLHFVRPLFDRVAYVHSLKEEVIEIPEQTAITKDNVTITMDGILYVKVLNPLDASYGVGDAVNAVVQLAQSTLRCELGKLTLDKTFEGRDTLNDKILEVLNEASQHWGLKCIRYEIKDITPPSAIKTAMEMQAEAERRKRAQILDSEADRQSNINMADGKKSAAILAAQGAKESTIMNAEAEKISTIMAAEAKKQRVILESEAAKIELVNRAEGEQESTILASEAERINIIKRAQGEQEGAILASEAERINIIKRAQGTAEGLQIVSEKLKESGGAEAASLELAKAYVDAFGKIAKEGTTHTMWMPAGTNDVGGAVAQALSIYRGMFNNYPETTKAVSVKN